MSRLLTALVFAFSAFALSVPATVAPAAAHPGRHAHPHFVAVGWCHFHRHRHWTPRHGWVWHAHQHCHGPRGNHH